MMERKETERGFLLGIRPKGERGALALLLTKRGTRWAYASLGNKIGGRSTPLGSLTGSLCDFDLAYKGAGEGGPAMVRGVTVAFPFPGFSSSLSTSSFFLVLDEAVEELLVDDAEDGPGIFLVYQRAVEILRERRNSLAALALFFAKSYEFLGLEPEVHSCVCCSRTDLIVSFSLQEGGFLCDSCAKEAGALPLGRKLLLTYRYLFDAPLDEMTPERIDGRVLREAVDALVSFLRLEYGAKLSSYDLYKAALS